MFQKQNKGKDLNKIPVSKLLLGPWLASTKRDGNYFQIVKKGLQIKFFTSGGKEFYWTDVAKKLRCKDFDFILEGEYTGTTEGKLGDRIYSTLTTDRVEWSKGRATNLGNRNIYIFDIIDCKHSRALERKQFLYTNFALDISLAKQYEVKNLLDAQALADSLCKDDWEGLVLRHVDHIVKPGKRVNDIIKLKKRPTADLKCIGFTYGEGKYKDMIGSLKLQDEKGLVVDVGSGLNDTDRSNSPAYYLGKIIEIGYEQILNTYIQPTFIGVRHDKSN